MAAIDRRGRVNQRGHASSTLASSVDAQAAKHRDRLLSRNESAHTTLTVRPPSRSRLLWRRPTWRMEAERVGAGATGLEPATSGVTGHFVGHTVDDDGCAIALFMRLFEALAFGSAWLTKADLDVCCPFAAGDRFCTALDTYRSDSIY